MAGTDERLLERVALHQTRLNTPGLTVDGRGVVIGTHVLVVASSLDRLVALLAALSNDGLLGRLSVGMTVLELAARKGGAKSWALRAPCSMVDLADRVRRISALVMGHTFVGGGGHFVEHRDASAPFGFDTSVTEDAGKGLALYHRAYSHAVDVAREIAPERLILALSPRPATDRPRPLPSERWILAEEGPGRALVGYLARSQIAATVGETSTSALSSDPKRRLFFVVPALPRRLRSLSQETPGLTCFVPSGAATAVEEGYHHPIALDGVAAFSGPRVTLFRGRGEPPVIVDEGLPRVSVGSLVRFTAIDAPPERAAASKEAAARVAMRLRVVPAEGDGRDTRAAGVPADELELLRRLLYTMGRRALEDTDVALTAEGALVRSRSSLLLPVGVPLRSIGPRVLVPVGFDVLPTVSTHALEDALEVAGDDVVFLRADGGAALFPRDAFVSAERALVAGPTWAPLTLQRLDVREIPLPDVELENVDLGLFPLRDLR